MKRLKLLYITEFYPYKGEITGGVENRVLNVAQRMVRKGHKVTVICSRQKNQPKHETINGVTVLRCGIEIPYSNNGFILRRIAFILSSFFNGLRITFDIVEGFNYLSYIPANLIGLINKKKRVATYHECWIGSWIKNKGVVTGVCGEIMERIVCFLHWDKIIAVSNTTKKVLKTNSKIEVVHNGVNLKELSKISSHNKEFDICCVSRLTEKKNTDILLHAIAKLKNEKKFKNIKVAIIGQGPEEIKLKHLSSQLEIAENILWKGFVATHSEVLSIIKKSKLFCTQSELEGFGITLVESMTLGTPIVCTDIDCFKEVCGKNKPAVMVKPRDVKQLTTTIKTILNDKQKRKRMKRLGLIRSKDFNWDVLCNNIENIYYSL